DSHGRSRHRQFRTGIHAQPAAKRRAAPRGDRRRLGANEAGNLRSVRGLPAEHSQAAASGGALYALLRRLRTEARTKQLNPMAERSYRGLLWSLVLVGLSVDQFSKYSVFKWLYHDGAGGHYEVVPGAFRLLAQFTDPNDPKNRERADTFIGWLRTGSGQVLPKVNHGALFGFLGEYEVYANTVFAVVSVAAALAIAFWSTRRSTARDPALCAALGLILGGTLGNLYDRVIFG